MTTDLSQIAEHLHQKNGIWETQNLSSVSYPSEDHSTIENLEEESFWFRHRRKFIMSFFSSPKKDERVLDLGGGTGFMSLAFQKGGFDVVLLEPTRSGVEAAKKKGILSIVCGSLQDVKFKESSFNHILLCDVLEHVEKDLEFLDDIRSLLVKGGRLYMTVPAFQFLWSQSDTDAGHFRRYNLSSLTSVLKKAGFQIVNRTYFFFPLVVPLFALRTLPWILGKRQTQTAETYVADHQPQGVLLQRLLAALLSFELVILKLGVRIPMGTSCFTVARRID